MNKQFRIFAHRGASAYAPENTVAAFILAQQLGARWIECDVMLTHDQQVIIFHDKDLQRFMNRALKISKVKYEALKTVDVGRFFSEKYQDSRIPTLADVLALTHSYPFNLNLEFKVSARQAVAAIEVSLPLLNAYPHIQYLISSFNVPVLEAFQAIAPHFQRALLCDNINTKMMRIAEKLQVVSINCEAKGLTAKKVALAHDQGYLVYAYTVNDSQRCHELKAMGVDGIFSDCLMTFSHCLLD